MLSVTQRHLDALNEALEGFNLKPLKTSLGLGNLLKYPANRKPTGSAATYPAGFFKTVVKLKRLSVLPRRPMQTRLELGNGYWGIVIIPWKTSKSGIF